MRELEGVPDQLDSGRPRIWCDDDLDHVETKKEIGVAQQAEPGERTQGQSTLLVAMHRLQRPSKIFPGAGFHLDKNERVPVATDQIDLPALSPTEVTIEDFVTMTPEIAGGEFFAARAEAQVLGASSPPQKRQGGLHALREHRGPSKSGLPREE